MKVVKRNRNKEESSEEEALEHSIQKVRKMRGTLAKETDKELQEM